jgi:predicted transcriptional regulator
MTTKQDLIHLVESLPDDADEDDLLYALYMRRSVELGIEDWKAGRVVSQEEVKKSLTKWLPSTGQ